MRNGVTIASWLWLLLCPFIAAGIVNAAPVTGQSPLAITKVGVDRKTFNLSSGEQTVMRYETNQQADIRVIVYDRLGQEVRSFDQEQAEPGIYKTTWDGRDSDGKIPHGEVFLYVIEAKSNNEHIVYNPAEDTGGQVVQPQEFTFDKKTGHIEYVLPKACMVRMRVGLKQGMLAVTIMDWQPQSAGRHTLEWEGKDVSGKMNLLAHPDLELNLTCYTLPANTIIATGTTIPFKPEKNVGSKATLHHRLWATEGKYIHYQHDTRSCYEPRFSVLFPDKSKESSPEKVPTVSGRTPIRVELDKRDMQDLINKRFEIMLFVDGIFVFEMEEGSSPFTFYWDTKGFTKGSHIVTVNIMSYDDHIGVVSREVIVGD